MSTKNKKAQSNTVKTTISRVSTISGKEFERKTDCTQILIDDDYTENKISNCEDTYLSKKMDDKEITFVQFKFKKIMEMKFGKSVLRRPDEAFIIEKSDNITTIKILEKKNQTSIGAKLLAGPSLKEAYKKELGNNFNIEYAFCLNNYYKDLFESKTDKYVIMQEILKENNISIFYGEDADYFDKLKEWIDE